MKSSPPSVRRSRRLVEIREKKKTQTHKTAYIGMLAVELFHMILDYLPARDLSAFSRTSTHHRALTEPILYRQIRWEPIRSWIDERAPPAHLLLRSILLRPELGSYINDFVFCLRAPSFQCGKYPSLWNHWKKPSPTSAEMMRVRSLIRSFKFASQDLWLSRLKLGEVDVFIALIISQATKLRHILLDDPLDDSNPYLLGEVLERALSMNFLCDLEHVEYSSNFSDPHIDHRLVKSNYPAIQPLFAFPSLKRLRISIPREDPRWLSAEIPITALKSLTLHYSQVSVPTLGIILRATPFLESLRYETWINIENIPHSPKEPWEYFDCSQLDRVLFPLHGTLKDLNIYLNFFSDGLIHIDPLAKFRGTTGKLESLRSFGQLKKLCMPTTLLSGWVESEGDWVAEKDDYYAVEELPPHLARLLPPSLHDLELSDDSYFHLTLPDDVSSDSSLDYDDGPYWFDYPGPHWWDYDIAEPDEFGDDDESEFDDGASEVHDGWEDGDGGDADAADESVSATGAPTVLAASVPVALSSVERTK